MQPMQQLMLPVLVKKSNALARAKWSPKNIWEPRLVALAAVQVRADDKDFQTYVIPVATVMGEDSTVKIGGDHYKRLKATAKKIVGSIIEIEDPGSKSFAIYGIFSKCEYKDGHFNVRFDPDLKPHFLQLKKHFTEYNLLEYLRLFGGYAQRIFEILRSWDDQPEISIDLEDLQERLAVPASLRANFKDFRMRVLAPAHREISKKTSLTYEWEPVKRGRKVIAVRFVFSRKRVAEVESKEKPQDDQKALQERNSLFKKALACKNSGPCGAPKNNKVCQVCKEVLSA